MPHISHDELNKRIAEAEKLVTVGATYKHYKYPKRNYLVEKICIQEATQKICIVYKDLPRGKAGRNFVNAPSFTRDLDSWLEKVEWEGAIVPRFKPAILES